MGSEVGQPSTQTNGLKRKAETQMMYCNVCKITLNSSLQASAHFAGKSHRNKAQGLSLEGGEPIDCIPTPVTNNLQNFNCELCQKVFNSSLQLKDHLFGKAHQQVAQSKLEDPPVTLLNEGFSAEISNPGTLNPGTLTPGVLNPGTLSPGTLNPGTLNPGVLNPGSLTPGTSVPGISTHSTSQDIAVKEETTTVQDATNEPSQPVGAPETLGKNVAKVFPCKMCNITLNSQKQLKQHNKGLRHKIIMGEANPPAVTGEKWENVRFMKISNAILGVNKDTTTGSGGGMNLREHHCEKCNITVNSKIQLDQHLQSNKHKMKGMQLQPSTLYNGQNKRKRGHGSGENQEWNNKRPNPGPLYDNIVHNNTYIPGGRGEPVYRLPPIPKPCYPVNSDLHNWTSNFGYDTTNLTMF